MGKCFKFNKPMKILVFDPIGVRQINCEIKIRINALTNEEKAEFPSTRATTDY